MANSVPPVTLGPVLRGSQGTGSPLIDNFGVSGGAIGCRADGWGSLLGGSEGDGVSLCRGWEEEAASTGLTSDAGRVMGVMPAAGKEGGFGSISLLVGELAGAAFSLCTGGS